MPRSTGRLFDWRVQSCILRSLPAARALPRVLAVDAIDPGSPWHIERLP